MKALHKYLKLKWVTVNLDNYLVLLDDGTMHLKGQTCSFTYLSNNCIVENMVCVCFYRVIHLLHSEHDMRKGLSRSVHYFIWL